MSSMDSIKQTFFQECEDLLGELESGLMLMDSGSGDMETVNAVFRAVHSIKGGAGAFNLTDLVGFAHIFENVLDDVRSETTEPTSSVNSLLLQSSDMLSDLVTAARDDGQFSQDRYDKLLSELRILSSKDSNEAPDENTPPAEEDFGFQPVMLDFGLDSIEPEPAPLSENVFNISFKPKPGLFANGSSATRLIRNLSKLGEVKVNCDLADLPNFGAFDPEDAFMSWNIELTSDASHEDVSEVFEFAEDDCSLEIIQFERTNDSMEDIQAPTPPASNFELPDLSELPPLNPELDQPTLNSTHSPILLKTIADIAAPVTPLAQTPTPIPAAEKQPDEKKKNDDKSKATEKPSAAPRAAPPATIRINLERVDRLINQVGELVINQAMLNECIVETGVARDPSILAGLEEFKQLTRNLQESVMAIRAQPVQPLFQRMSRIVREAADATQKSAKLVMEGEFTEVDKTIVEKLADPLTHMIRNAIDHGLETPEERIAKGKPADGMVKLSAAHRSGKIVIEVSDDGAGINRERVKKIAIDKGLIAADENLTDNEIDNLLFRAGFSTVEKISTLSGRGVGMDVVKRAIQSIGGRIAISSEPDKGSTFTINLPLTLAVLDGMLIKVAGQTIVVPLTAIVETLLPIRKDIHKTGPRSQVVNIRGTFVPLIDLGSKLNFRSNRADFSNCVILSVETEAGAPCALLVDKIQDQRQVVIKSLEDNYGHVPCVAAATILGDGRIALILDVDEVVLTSKAPPASKSLNSAVKEAAYV